MRNRIYRIAMTVNEETMKLVFDLLHGEAKDFQLRDITDQPGTIPVPAINGQDLAKKKYTPTDEQRNRWASKHWPDFEAVLRASPDFTCSHNDERLRDRMIAKGNAGHSMSPMWTIFERAGKVKRIGRGVYQLVSR